jgi:uncharacterized protein RhaS with RHS repeats
LYYHDSWKVTPRLTLELGLRWEKWTPYQEKYNRLVNLDIRDFANKFEVVTPGNIAMESLPGIPSEARQRLEFSYDYQGRRIRKTVFDWNPGEGSWVLSADFKFLYDGWNLIAILDAGNNLLQSFSWGTDLSGTMEGAGGVGGLISMTDYHPGTAGIWFYTYDGNGNVSALVNAADGGIAARYEYGPFGETLRLTGPAGRLNPFRFSTKYTDDESDLVCYGHRYYNPATGTALFTLFTPLPAGTA